MHCTKFGHDVCHFRDISASIIQGSGIGPVSYAVTASDLHPVYSGNLMSKYADDTYLVIPASNANTCTAEVEHIEAWSNTNLQLNRVKSLEIVFERPRTRSNRKQTIPPPTVPGICRVEHVKVIGVTISRKFSVSSHVDELLAKCSQSLLASAIRPICSNSRLLLLINWLTPALLGMVSPAQQIVDDWTLFFDGQQGSTIVMLSLRHLTFYVKQPINSSSLK